MDTSVQRPWQITASTHSIVARFDVNGEAIDAPNARQSLVDAPPARRPGTQGKQGEGGKWAPLSTRTARQSTRQMRDNHQPKRL